MTMATKIDARLPPTLPIGLPFILGFILVPMIGSSLYLSYGPPCAIFCGGRDYWNTPCFGLISIIAVVTSAVISNKEFTFGLFIGVLVTLFSLALIG